MSIIGSETTTNNNKKKSQEIIPGQSVAPIAVTAEAQQKHAEGSPVAAMKSARYLAGGLMQACDSRGGVAVLIQQAERTFLGVLKWCQQPRNKVLCTVFLQTTDTHIQHGE